MTLDKDDVKLLAGLIDDSLDSKLGKNLEKIGGLVDEKLLDFHEKVTAPMIETKLLDFHEKVTAPMIETKLLDFHEKVTAPMIDSVVFDLKEDILKVDNKIDRIERKLDNMTDMLTDRISDHERRITKIEIATFSS